jgi:tripartite-type tricarboxylate transporter receptor subunit TctC
MRSPAALPPIRDGKPIPLAARSAARSAAVPTVPTTLEAGLKDSDYQYWLGLFVPAKTPRAIIDRLYAETQKVLATPEVQAKFKPVGIEPLKMTSAEFDAMIKREVAANIALAKAAKLKFN